MKKRKTRKRIAWVALIGFVVINTIAAFHAYKFTHFDPDESKKVTNPNGLSLTEKMGVLLFGVDLPRPVNRRLPEHSFETITLQSTSKIECWLIRKDSAKGTVVLFHGYGGEKSSMLDKAALFRNVGYNTMLVDFMGAGGSEGNQCTIGFKEAEQVKSSVQYLAHKGEKNVVLFGTSMGAAAILKAMNDDNLPVQKLILECPFSTMVKTVKNRFRNLGVPSFPMAYLLVFWGGTENGFNAFSHDPLTYAKKVTLPTLLMYGEKDDRVDMDETVAIFQNLATTNKKLVTFPLSGHENYLIHYKDKWNDEVKIFLETAVQ